MAKHSKVGSCCNRTTKTTTELTLALLIWKDRKRNALLRTGIVS